MRYYSEFLSLWCCLTLVGCLQPRRVIPDYHQAPFRAFWNVPSANCYEKYGIDLLKTLSDWGIIVNSNGGWIGDQLSIWTSGQLGYYPYYSQDGQPVNGGLPQLGNLTTHLQKAGQDIEQAVSANFSGPAIMDWESWRPTWERNFDAKSIYQEESKKLVQAKHPDWSDDQIEAEAKKEFEESAKQWMTETLQLGKKLRPTAQWGFYHFPYCLNNKSPNLTCPEVQKTYNDQSMWLFNISTALYPSIYLGKNRLENETGSVEGILEEALRVASQSSDPSMPVYAYTRFNYSNSNLYLTNKALNATIGQAALLGLDGVILWGDHNDTGSEAACQQLQRYIDQILGPLCDAYIDLAHLCSRSLCALQGRCHWEDESLKAKLLADPLYLYNISHCYISCRCSGGWSGTFCDDPFAVFSPRPLNRSIPACGFRPF